LIGVVFVSGQFSGIIGYGWNGHVHLRMSSWLMLPSNGVRAL
jgi:hypothetical protein